MALIIGHSQLKYSSHYKQDNAIRCVYSSGCLVEELVTLPAVKEAIPSVSVVAVHCGINNIPRDATETLLEKFQRLYEDIKQLNPKATVIFSSILPRTQSEFAKKLSTATLNLINSTANEVNSTLYKISRLECFPDIEFLSHDPVFQPDDCVQIVYTILAKTIGSFRLETKLIVYSCSKA